MPIYEFRCEECGARFEQLLGVGAESIPCPECGSVRTVRAYSAPVAPFHLVKTPGEARKQERRNAQLQASARARFKEARARARRRAGGGGASGGAR